ncbi:hypothetical protein KAR91_81565 [Candidatus Pacearchaeota archaeon]|nr:hypothetical protein [Candidatus Pacearchaeota archaeon]
MKETKKFKIDQGHYDRLDYVQRATREEVQDMLLSRKDIITYQGKVYRLISTPMGCGVYEIKKHVTPADVRNEYDRLNMTAPPIRGEKK